MEVQEMQKLVSIILPVYNAENWLEECLKSVVEQTYKGSLELCVFNDGSTDRSVGIIKSFASTLASRGIDIILTENHSGSPKGCGYAKNRAVESSHGEYLCFLDADDVMYKKRVELQLEAALKLSQNHLIGCKIIREPLESTTRYTHWINNLTLDQLYTQIYTSNGPTVVMPTWFCHRNVFSLVGGFETGCRGVPEDYIFFLKFVDLGGMLHRVDEILLKYRHHPQATTHSISEQTIWNVRLAALERNILSKWPNFTIWNAGKQGRKLYRDICEESKNKVSCFCDVDEKKLALGHYTYELSTSKLKPKIPILHFTAAPKPFVLCVKLGMTNGQFECNLASLNITEGRDYVVFS